MGIKKRENNENNFSENLNSKGFLLANFYKPLACARYVPRCPPTTEVLVYDILQLQKTIKRRNTSNL